MGASNPPLISKLPVARGWIIPVVVAACWFAGGLALSRLLFEGLFPAWPVMGRPVGAIALGTLASGLGVVAAVFLSNRKLAGGNPALVAATFLPLLINLAWLFDPTVEPARGRFLFAAGLWMSAVLLAWSALGDKDKRWDWLGPLFVIIALLPVYLLTMSHAVGAADTFEFQVVAPQLGIAHPTGYPLYLLLGKLFSLLPFGAQAWRVNLASAFFAVAATMVVFRLGLELFRRPLPALVGAVALGLVPIFWSQAIVAEVYTLHALVVAVALWLMARLIEGPQTADNRPQPAGEGRMAVGGSPSAIDRKIMVGLAFVLGLGLTNHLTTIFLLPPAALAIFLTLWPIIGGQRSAVGGRTSRRRSLIPLFFQLLIAFAVPLLLYTYLPLRWEAVNGEPMGLGRFVEWVVGGRFQGALQWGAWLHDPARREIVGRLLLDAWGWFYLALAVVGLAWLFIRQWRAALVLLVSAVGFTFYALNYYVPDLAVFLIPIHVVIAVCVTAGVAGVVALGGSRRESTDSTNLRLETEFFGKNSVSVVFILALLLGLLAAGERWSAIDQSGRDGGEPWARLALAQPLARRAAILADSEKIAPLYYLQQAEGLRPDLNIMVLPDEAAYRAELDARLAAGQTVYLARYLPGLAGVFHLRSAGPLVEVSREPLIELPANANQSALLSGPLRLVGYAAEPVDGLDSVGLTLYWTLDRALGDGEQTPVIYLRWASGENAVNGAHPAGDAYPINAWRSGEIVADYHLLPLLDMRCGGPACEREIQVAAGPRFTPAADLTWQTVASIAIAPRSGPVGQPRRAFFDGFALDGVEFPATSRPGVALPLRYSGFGDSERLRFLLVPTHAVSSFVFPAGRGPTPGPAATESMAFAAEIEAATEGGPHALVAYSTGEAGAVCGWLSPNMTGCVVAEIDISGAPLPEGATNFDDKIALVDVEVAGENFAPGGQLPVTLSWLGLAEMAEDYTVFVQVLDAADRIVGQVDAWPVQGTFPTSQWRPGETVTDPYVVQLSTDLPPGDYRLHVGFYLLSTGQRLPVVDEAGNAVDDKVEVGVSKQ